MLDYLFRAARFFKRNAFRNTRYLLTYALHLFDPGYAMHPAYMSERELADALDRGKSLIRIGDGEIYLINFGSIHYQAYHPRLRAYLLDMIREYGRDAPYLIGIPEQYLGMSNRELSKIGLLRCWLPFKIAYARLFNDRATYLDAHLFYRGDSFRRVLERQLIGRNVLLVTSPANWETVRQAGMALRLNVELVPCPASNAFDEFDDLRARVRERIAPGGEDGYRVLISAGPASKALAYALSKEGIVSYDLGRGIEAVYRPNEIEHLI